jgi:hypothetical protein
MVKITLDHSAMIFYDRHPAIERLIRMEEEGKVRLYHAQNLNRDLASINKTEEKIYDRLRQMVFARKQEDLNLAEHGDLVLLINHMKSKRDYFITMDKDRYANLHGHGSLDIRFPDDEFLSEIESRLGAESRRKAEKAAKPGKAANKKPSRNPARDAKSRKSGKK